MALYKEIVTKAIIGKGKKKFKNSYQIIPTEDPTTVLGCWVINHEFKGYKKDNMIGVDGTFDVNIWYSYENNTKTNVVNKKIDYNDTFNVKLKADADLSSDTDIIVRSLNQPTCSSVKIDDDNKISFDIEKELGVEIVGETKVKISIEEDEEPWDDIEDEVTEEVLEEINNIEEDYLK